ncbi:hypothetical protein DP73_03750 [Desulfosporosinus sp. HMP52]|uniref:tetratricopeptide repeat protein n=1 Tax=Desulfosporosinus sp. HMP52 TaxID=1487923 RepID=UPI00051FC68A|nr:tetratricopeptide repeat protein [Desulfosporosinus sp. HMP52]KGK91391.1 hypothetical protein DP73_03750 [Desulfosporosinus sp. HMP52]
MKITKKIVIIVITALVLLIGGGVVYATNSTAARAERQLNLGNKYLQEGKYEEAILAFEKVIQIEPKNIPARLGLGKVYVATNEFEKAEKVLQEVFEIEPNHLESHEDLCRVYLMQGKLEEANAMLQKIIKIGTSGDVKELSSDLESANAINASKASYDQGVKQMNEKQYLKAVDSFQKVIREDTERYSDAQTKIGDCKKAYVESSLQSASDLAKATKYDDAIKILNDVLKIDANNQDIKNLIVQYTQAIAKAKADSAKLQAEKDTAVKVTRNQTSNVIDKNTVKVGDVIAGLTVKTIDDYGYGSVQASFSGQIELDGTYEYSENYGDGDGYVFTVSVADQMKLPYFKGDRSVTSLPILNASKHLTNKSGKAKVVIDNYRVNIGIQIQAIADLVKATVE